MQAVASASAAPMNAPGERHRRTPSTTAPPSPHHPSLNPNPGGSATPAVRLPPVSIPRDDFLPVNFNPERRQSINSDPFLHAFSATSDPSFLRRPSIDESSALFNGGFQGQPHPGPNPDFPGISRGAERGGMMAVAGHPHSPRVGVSHAMPPPPPHSFDPHPHYQFGTSFGSTSQHPAPSDPHSHSLPHPHSSFPGPNSSYRFGGPPLTATAAPLDPPSYFDYSMRRHSLTNNQSPTRFSQQQGGGGGPPSTASTKRKSSNEEDEPVYNDGSFYPRDGSSYPPTSMEGNQPPPSKRKTPSFATDKMSGLDLNDPNRRESYSPTWEERRGSDESYRSAGSQQGYSMFHPAQGGHSLPPPNPPNPHQHPDQPPQQQPHPSFMRPSNHPNYYDDQVGPRGSIARGMYEPEHQNFGRRPSIPGISQMIQGSTPFYPGQPPHSAPPTAQHPPPSSSPAPRTSGPPQPSLTVPSAPPSGSKVYPVGPPPQWPTSVPSSGGPAGRQGSGSSLEPNSGSKDSPYSRSPELRVSHKLAERKRRKEMAQLFDDLRESLPGDKGVKSSKWEILTKAVEFIAQLKVYNRELQSDNSNLRNHLNLPQSRPPPHELRSDSSVTPHPLQPAPPPNPVHFVEHSPHPHSQPSAQHPGSHSHHASPRPHASRTGSHASNASSLSIDNGLPN